MLYLFEANNDRLMYDFCVLLDTCQVPRPPPFHPLRQACFSAFPQGSWIEITGQKSVNKATPPPPA